MTTDTKLTTALTFLDLGLSAELGRQVIAKGFTVPTPIQEKGIPIVVSGDDLIGIAQTGTGKTFAFGLPLIDALKERGTQALIVVPTRELASQIIQALEPFLGAHNMRSALLIGGVKLGPQRGKLQSRPALVVGTPGRILDHVKERNFDLRNITHYVLDEADRMLDLGFRQTIEALTLELKNRRQTLL